jgi:hypothetical protein
MKSFVFTGFVLAMLLCGCATSQRIPKSFSQHSASGWASMEVREEVGYDRAWDVVYTLLVRDFEMEFASKEDGYMRTAWLHSWSGVYQSNYRVRVAVKFAQDRKTLDIKSEAQVQRGNVWLLGVDNRQLATLKTDLMGTIARTTR